MNFDRPLWFEEVSDGMAADLGSYTFSRERILDFARQFDPQDFHLSDAAAGQGPFGKLTASGWHTSAAFMHCYVAFLDRIRAEARARGDVVPPSGPSPGFEDMEWLRPVYTGDIVRYTILVTGKRDLKSRPEWGLVLTRIEGRNQENAVVFRFTGKLLIATKAAHTAA
ncbi:MAG: MaoC/PaaZ C-terminal domain-containing protein [Hyphomicrobiales bacterium]